MKKKLDEAIKVVEETVAENANMKEELQVQKDLVVALKLKIDDKAPKKAENYVRIVENEEGPLPEGQRKCEKCKFSSTNRVLMKAHKDAYHKAIPKYSCRMCGSVAANLENYEKHKEKHNKELQVGSTNNYPMNVYSFKCKPCKLSFRNHDMLIDHMSSVHVPERQRQLKERSHDEGNEVQLCRNGDGCYYHKQHRCSYYHALPPQEKPRHFPRQSPDSQWRTVHNRRPRPAGPGGQLRQGRGGDQQQQGRGGVQQRQVHGGEQQWQGRGGNQQWQGHGGDQQLHGYGGDQQWQGDGGDQQWNGRGGDQQQQVGFQQQQEHGDHQWQGRQRQGQGKWGGSREISTPWCRHVHNCLQGRFCALRNIGEQDFTSQPYQGRH